MDSWKAAGSQWKAWSSISVSVTLKIGDEKIHVISCYAPTRAASTEVKTEFYDEISSILERFPGNESYILLGDFNACVGCRELEGSDDPLSNARGHHAFGEVKDAMKELFYHL